MSITFSETEWVDGEDGGTPINAAELNERDDLLTDLVDAANTAVTDINAVEAVNATQTADIDAAEADIDAVETGVEGLEGLLNGKQTSGDPLGTVALDDSSVQYGRVNIPDDGSSTATWPDRFVFYFNGIRTGYHNEYGELRCRPAKINTVPLRVQNFSGGSSGNLQEWTEADNTVLSSVSANGTFSGPNIGAKVVVLSGVTAIPANTPVGSLVVRY